MRKITEMKILLRERVELPHDFELATDEFREGWKLVQSLDARGLEEEINAYGWHFIRIADGSLRSGVGETSQDAIGNALRLALRRVGELFNAAEIAHIELTQYPWFFLARVEIYPFRIQQSAILPLRDHYEPLPVKPRRRRLPISASALYPHFGSAMPELKQMLVSSGTVPAGPQ
jgi:hypothetical protein